MLGSNLAGKQNFSVFQHTIIPKSHAIHSHQDFKCAELLRMRTKTILVIE